MKKLIAAFIAIITMFVTCNASADEVDVALYIRDVVPDATVEDARECSRVWQKGGMYKKKIKNIHLECRRRYIALKWGYSKE